MLNYTRNLVATDRFHLWSFEIEEQFSLTDSYLWMNKYWWSSSLVLVVLYLTLTYFGVGYMQGRKRFSLRTPLFIWNANLAIFYLWGVTRTLPELSCYWRPNGFYSLVCEECPFGCTKASQFWAWVFTIMKGPELLDTAFVVLRKQPLFFLHWYHHCSVLVFTWYLFSHLSSAGVMFALVNALVHTLMYFYYALKILAVRIPKSVSMALTVVQLSQMAIGFYTSYYVLQVKRRGLQCSVTDADIIVAFLIYISYFLLFVWYFYKTYIDKDARFILKKVN